MLLLVTLLWFACVAAFLGLVLAYSEPLDGDRDKDGKDAQEDISGEHD